MRKLNFPVLTLVLIFLTLAATAQSQQPAEMADNMRSNGKIYVVIAVILTILGGLIAYVIRLDRKISRLEKDSQ